MLEAEDAERAKEMMLPQMVMVVEGEEAGAVAEAAVAPKDEHRPRAWRRL